MGSTDKSISPAPSSRLLPSNARGEKAFRRVNSLDANDGHGFFQALDDSVITGPTYTNVNDFRAVVITGDSSP